MKRTYTVSQDKNGLWYAHKAGYSYIPSLGSFNKTKRGAQKWAADAMCLLAKAILLLMIRYMPKIFG